MPTPDLSTPYLDALAKRLRSAVSALARWLVKRLWPSLVRHVRPPLSALFAWLGGTVSRLGFDDLFLVGGLVLLALGLRLVWLPLAYIAPGLILTAMGMVYLLRQSSTPPPAGKE